MFGPMSLKKQNNLDDGGPSNLGAPGLCKSSLGYEVGVFTTTMIHLCFRLPLVCVQRMTH